MTSKRNDRPSTSGCNIGPGFGSPVADSNAAQFLFRAKMPSAVGFLTSCARSGERLERQSKEPECRLSKSATIATLIATTVSSC